MARLVQPCTLYGTTPQQSFRFDNGGRKMRTWVTIIALALLAITPALAQNFPSRTITLIVPFPPGGSTDVAGRILAEKMRAGLGAPVIVENVGGAGGSLGGGRLGRAAPRGHTIEIR